tara:strand:- start:780 stop:2750 length:1971 start_codon:yes stop_codon:yes gene_type:complete
MKFRADINGLRAFAVVAVVLFHFNHNWAPGGFAGVDVFFVISGFLMTGIIFRGIENNNFSIIGFYVARAKRIIPALSLMCLAVLLFGWFYLTPLDYRALGKHVASSMGFISNIIYWRESGYFDAASNSKWLLHTWSLSVEWQFYIIYPVILVLMKKFTSSVNIKRLLVVATIVGFAFSAYATYHWPDSAYFLLPTRAWEMMVGGIAFLYPFHLKANNKKYFQWLGITLILTSYLFISEDNPWPGYLALLPVLGTYFVIISNRNDSRITNNFVTQKIGLWSYSIYLWHWPIVVLGNYLEINNWEWFGIILSVFLGVFSYRYIEKIKFHTSPNITPKSLFLFKPLWMAISIGLVSSFIFIEHGIKSRVDELVVIAERASTDRNPMTKECFYSPDDPYDAKPCIIGNRENIKAVIVGDSHADALSAGVLNAFNLEEDGVVTYLRHSCPFILDVKNKTFPVYNCTDSNAYNFKEITSKYKHTPVFLINRTSVYLYGQSESSRITNDNSPSVYFTKPYRKVSDDLLNEFSKHYIDTICKLEKTNPVFITTPTPEMLSNVPKTIAKLSMLSGQENNITLPKPTYEERNAFVYELMSKVHNKCNSTILDTSKHLCSEDICYGSIKGKPLYYDGDHMSVFGSKMLTPLFKSAMSENVSKISIKQ